MFFFIVYSNFCLRATLAAAFMRSYKDGEENRESSEARPRRKGGYSSLGISCSLFFIIYLFFAEKLKFR